MENLSLETAYARYGAQVSSKQRCLSAIAADGSLVLSCPADRFSRPGVGVRRYSARLSLEIAAQTRVAVLRDQVQKASTEGIQVRPVFITAPKGHLGRIIHVRSDLVGKVVDYDGDSFVVDFRRPPPPPVVETKKRRKR